MSEELWLALTGSVEPSPCFGGLASQSFELLHRPSNKMFVDARCDAIQLGAVEGPVVVEPASDPGVDGPGESGEVAPTVEVPVRDLFAGLVRWGSTQKLTAKPRRRLPRKVRDYSKAGVHPSLNDGSTRSSSCRDAAQGPACGCRKLCRGWSGGISVLVHESVPAGRSQDLEVSV